MSVLGGYEETMPFEVMMECKGEKEKIGISRWRAAADLLKFTFGWWRRIKFSMPQQQAEGSHQRNQIYVQTSDFILLAISNSGLDVGRWIDCATTEENWVETYRTSGQFL